MHAAVNAGCDDWLGDLTDCSVDELYEEIDPKIMFYQELWSNRRAVGSQYCLQLSGVITAGLLYAFMRLWNVRASTSLNFVIFTIIDATRIAYETGSKGSQPILDYRA